MRVSNLKISFDGARYEQGIRDFANVYYKEELKKGTLKNSLFCFVVCIVILGVLSLAFKRQRVFILGIIALIFLVYFFVGLVITLSLLLNRKRRIDTRFEKVEQYYGKNVEIVVYFKNGSIEKNQYNYHDFIKLVDGKDFFFLFIQNSVAIPIDKNCIENKEEFINLFISESVKVRGENNG